MTIPYDCCTVCVCEFAHRCGVSRLVGCSWRRAEERWEECPAEGGAALAVALEDAGVAVVDSTLRAHAL